MKTSISKRSIILILTLIFISLFIIITFPVSAENPVYVDDDFSDATPGWGVTNFSNIQNGIDAVDENGTVFVNAGTYSGFYNVNKTITITGEEIDSVWVSGIFYVTSNDVLIEKITIANVSGGDFSSGIYDESSNSIYRNLHLLNNTRGIELSYLSLNTLINENLFEENNYGVYAYETSPYAFITNNTFENNTFGILIDSSQFFTIFHNTIINNDEVGFSLLSSKNYHQDKIRQLC